MNARLEFVDTNILLYSIDQTEARKHQLASKLLERLWQSRCGCLSIQVLQEFYWNATRKVSVPLEAATARQLVEDYGHWLVHSPTVEAVLAGITLQADHKVSFWDALILGSAHYLGASILWTEDLQHGQKFGSVEVRNPFLET